MEGNVTSIPVLLAQTHAICKIVMDGYDHNGLNTRAVLLLTVWRWFHIFNFLSMYKNVSCCTV